ncbi:MAG TPA: hypothetical protein VNA04_13660 [Thermoanaerobaculia bacterium]|nr:hypothetical protein [Thermoanaerobaculia bacterium]
MIPDALRITFLAVLATTILIVPATISAQVAVTRSPGGIMQVSGDSKTDSFVVANGGEAAVSVTVTGSAAFFTVTPSSFVLAPRSSQTVTIRPEVTGPGLYDGTATVSVPGGQRPLTVAVRLFIASATSGFPTGGDVTAILGSSFVLLSGLPHEIRSATFNVSNAGTDEMQGLMVADVPWVGAPSNLVSVGPGATARIAFSVNPALRPDSPSALGALIGSLSMNYFHGSAQTAKATVTVLDITKAAVVPQQPLALAAGEIASFLAGITDTTATSHLFLSNRTTSALSGIQLFYSAAGAGQAGALLAAIPQFPPSGSAWFPLVPGSLFNVSNQSGSVQLRTLQAGQASLSGLLANVPDAQNLYLTSIPLLRSDGAVGSNGRLAFAGVEKSTAASTDLHIQETAGHAGSFTVDFFDAAGAPVAPSRSESIPPFAYVPLPDSVPAGARSARVSNTGGGATRLAGYAAVVDAATRDRWTITDSRPGAGSPSELFVPMPSFSGIPSATLEVWVTNDSARAAKVTLATSPQPLPPPRRRAAGHGLGSSSLPVETTSVIETFVLAPSESRKVTVASAPQGHVRIYGPPGAISASGRLVSTAPGRQGSFGTGIPALPSSAAGGTGSRKQFSLADDQPGVLPPALLLLETTGRPATVRATIRFSFPGGSTATGQAEASRDYEVPAGELLTIADLTRSILGAQRDQLGRLFKLVIDVEVTGGDGRVLTFLQITDRSGDTALFVD